MNWISELSGMTKILVVFFLLALVGGGVAAKDIHNSLRTSTGAESSNTTLKDERTSQNDEEVQRALERADSFSNNTPSGGTSAVASNSNQSNASRATTSPTPTPSSRTSISAADQASIDKLNEERRQREAELCKLRKDSITSQYEVAILELEAQHNNTIDGISNDARERGVYYGGWTQEALNQENNLYQSRKTALESDYRAKLATLTC